MSREAADRPGTQIQSVARAARLLLFVAEQPDGATAKEIALRCGLALPTTYHLLTTLVAEGLLAKDTKRRYSVGPKVGALTDAFLRDLRTPEWLLLPLRTLAERTGETVSLAAWRRHEMRVLMTIEGEHALRVSGLHSGYDRHAHARATGKLLLAYASAEVRREVLDDHHPLAALTPHTIVDPQALAEELDRIRRRGYAYDEEEFAEGVCCVAAPIIEHRVVIAAYCVLAPLARFHDQREELTNAVLDAAGSVAAHARQELIHKAF